MAVEMNIAPASRYRHLEPKPHKRSTCQLGFRGRNMLVWNLIAAMRTEGYTPEEAARNFDLPLDAVYEALDYFARHAEEILAENEQVGRDLGLVH